ncbi:Hsp70 family protein [Intestinibacter sp.]
MSQNSNEFEDYENSNNENDSNSKIGKEIGIDLGTTNSVVSYIDKNGAVNYVKVAGNILIPSQIFFKDREHVYYGNKAKSYAKGFGEGTSISLFKKYLRADSKKIIIKISKDKTKDENNNGKKYYILDTNVFIDQPNILESMNKNEMVFLPITVEQELEYRKTDDKTKYSAAKALEQLVKFKDIIKYVESDEDLLPQDFFRKFTDGSNNSKNDNKILSIALKFKDENVTLVTSDNCLAKLKSDFVGVKAMTLREFQLLKLSESENGEFEISGTEASAMFLGYLKKEAERFIKEPVTKAVITVPATFNIVEIENTKKAGFDAGFEEIHIEKEPTAAAIAYNIDTKSQASTFIYDFGGGTFDVSIIKSDKNGKFEICATSGNSKLGGEDITKVVEEYIYDYLEDNYDLTMFTQEESELTKEQYIYNKNMIYWEADKCKMELSMSESTEITLVDLYINEEEQKSVFITLTRHEFENIIKPTITQTISEMNNALSKADMFKEDVDNIILAGGTSLIPCIKEQVERYFGRKPSADKNAATLIAEGAAIIANTMYGNNNLIKLQPKIFDITFEDFGVALEKWSYSCIIPAGTELPASAEKAYSLVEDNQSQLNIKVFSRKSEAQESLKTYDNGVEYLDELIMSNLPRMNMDEVDVVVKFEITKQYELKTDVKLLRKDGDIIDKGNMLIDRQSML